MLSALSCFGPRRVIDDEWDVGSQGSDDLHAGIDREDGTGSAVVERPVRKKNPLFPNKKALNRDALRRRLKNILDNIKKDTGGKKSHDRDRDPEFILLGKIYSEINDDISSDLNNLSKNREALNHLLPFILNSMLYGNHEGSRIHDSSRSTKKSGSLRMNRSAKEITLNGASHLQKNEFNKKLETFLYTQALNSVHIALDCSWFFTASLFLGPQECYHKTMTMLLGMESVVTNAALPGDLFRRAGMSNNVGGIPRELRAITTSSATALNNMATIPEDSATNTTPAPSPSPPPGSPSPPPLYLTPPASPIANGMNPGASTTTILDPASPVASTDNGGSANGNGNSAVSRSERPVSIREVTLDTKDKLKIKFGDLKTSDEARLSQWLDARRERSNTFHAELDFIKCLTDISNGLFSIDRELRRDMLRSELEKLNNFIPANVFIPTERRRHRVLRIVPEQAHVFSTKERVPYLLVVEVEDLVSPDMDDHDGANGNGNGNRGKRNMRRIGSTGGGGNPGASHGHGRQSRKESTNAALPPIAEEPRRADTNDPNRPERAFQFESMLNPSTSELMKRESSFHIESQFPDDRRPPDEELLKALGEPWDVKSERLRKLSPFGDRPYWRLISCIVKARDQLRQEMLAQRLIQEFTFIFKRAKLSLWLKPYQIISTSSDSGLIETVVDAKSIDSIKKHSPNVTTLQDYFVGRFGGRGSQAYKRAVKNFVQSMAGYSVIQYLLNIKDRHNGNLMIDAEGHIVHIDFGFLLSNSPGGNMEFEKAPFKLTSEMVAVMGGVKSGTWKHFRKLCIQGYVEACRNADKIMLMVDLAYPGNESMPCFLQGRDYVLESLRERFGVDLSKRERITRMARLIGNAHGNWTTKAYDQFQKMSLGIAK